MNLFQKCKTKAIGVQGIGFYTHQIKECKENFINEAHQKLKIANLLDCTSWSGDGPRLMDAFTQGSLQLIEGGCEAPIHTILLVFSYHMLETVGSSMASPH